MRRIGGQILLSSGDLEGFLACRHCAALRLRSLDEDLPQAADDEAALLLQRKGIEHEKRHLASLAASGLDVAEIGEEGDLADRAAATLDAMRRGADVIYQGVLVAAPWHGYADFLMKRPFATVFGGHGYEPWDTKLARTPRPEHVLQLCVYGHLLEQTQHAPPKTITVALGDGGTANYPFADFRHYFSEAKGRLERFVRSPVPATRPQPCPHCPVCEWRDLCSEEWDRSDHLGRVAGIRRDQIAKLERGSIATMAALAAAPSGTTVDDLAFETFDKLRRQAMLQVRKTATGKNAFELLPLREGRGLRRMPKPAKGDLFFDIEGDPLHPDGLDYLFGVVHRIGRRVRHRSFWGHDHDAERAAFEQVMDFIVSHVARHPDAHVYHYAHYEETAIKRLSCRYGTREGVVDDLLRQGRLIDLYKVVRESVRISEPSYSLKNVEVFYMPGGRSGVTSAMDSVVHYDRWRQSGDDRLLREIESYNREDCRSLMHLRDWLVGLRPDDLPWFEEAGADDMTGRQDVERRRAELQARFVEGGADEAERGLRRVVFDLLGFHRRAAKPVWWRMFDRQGRDEDDLIEDADCLGGLHALGDAEWDGDEMVRAFRFPRQDTKLRDGDRCRVADTLERAGRVVSLDLGRCVVRLDVRGAKAALPDRLSLIPEGPLADRVLREAVWRVAQSVHDRDGRFSAVQALLRRDSPPPLRQESRHALGAEG